MQSLLRLWWRWRGLERLTRIDGNRRPVYQEWCTARLEIGGRPGMGTRVFSCRHIDRDGWLWAKPCKGRRWHCPDPSDPTDHGRIEVTDNAR